MARMWPPPTPGAAAKPSGSPTLPCWALPLPVWGPLPHDHTQTTRICGPSITAPNKPQTRQIGGTEISNMSAPRRYFYGAAAPAICRRHVARSSRERSTRKYEVIGATRATCPSRICVQIILVIAKICAGKASERPQIIILALFVARANHALPH
jgi:hypothetical protein